MPITPQQLIQDLRAWLQADATAIEQARVLGAGGWEQWCIIQFINWQISTQPPGANLDFWRELPVPADAQGQARFIDVAYNVNSVNPQAGFPLILSEWKAGNNGNTVSQGAMEDIGKLVEFDHAGVSPLIVALSPQAVNFPGVQASGAVNGTAVQIYTSTPATWQWMGVFPVNQA